MTEELSKQVFDFLIRRLGEEVTCNYWLCGKKITTTGYLDNVIPFDSVVIDREIIPFIGKDTAIEEIKSNRINKTLYFNMQAQNYVLTDIMSVVSAQKETFGKSILLEQLEKKH